MRRLTKEQCRQSARAAALGLCSEEEAKTAFRTGDTARADWISKEVAIGDITRAFQRLMPDATTLRIERVPGGDDLAARWLAVRDWTVLPSSDAPNRDENGERI